MTPERPALPIYPNPGANGAPHPSADAGAPEDVPAPLSAGPAPLDFLALARRRAVRRLVC